jgi:hypothetical protein
VKQFFQTMTAAVILFDLEGIPFLITTDKRIPPLLIESASHELSRKILRLRIADLKNSAGPREVLPNFREGKVNLSETFNGQYYLLNEVYIGVVSRVSPNAFIGDVELKRAKELLIRLNRGVDVTIAAISKKFGEVVVALESVLDGFDLADLDLYQTKSLNDIAAHLAEKKASVKAETKPSLPSHLQSSKVLDELSKEDCRYRQLAFESRWARERTEFEGAVPGKILSDLKSRSDGAQYTSAPAVSNFDKHFLADHYEVSKRAELEAIRKRDEKGGLKKMDRATLNFTYDAKHTNS